MEWIWRPMNSILGESAQIFAGAFFGNYDAPH